MIQNGNFIRLLLNGTIVAKLTSLDFSLEAEMLDKTTKDSSGDKEVQPGNRSFSLSCEGFVVDPYDRNMVLYSEEFYNAFWVVTDGTKDTDLYAAPDGFIKASQVNLDALGGVISASLGLNSVAGTNYTFSIWVKQAGNYNLTIGDSSQSNVEAIVSTGAWVRYETTYLAVTGGSQIVVSLENADLVGMDTQIFGAQVEAGTATTQYEPTGIRYEELFESIEAGTQLTALITDQTTDNVEYEGAVQINSVARTANQGQLQTFSCELTGTGALTPNTI